MHRERFRGAIRLGAAVLAVALVGLTGCAAEPQARTGAAPSESTSTPSPQPAPPTPEELRHARAVDLVTAMSTRDQAASIVMSTTPGTDAATLRAFVDAEGLGGVILMASNVPGTPEELAALTAALSPDADFPLLIGIDQEGGVVSRLPWDAFRARSPCRRRIPQPPKPRSRVAPRCCPPPGST